MRLSYTKVHNTIDIKLKRNIEIITEEQGGMFIIEKNQQALLSNIFKYFFALGNGDGFFWKQAFSPVSLQFSALIK